MTLPGLPTEQQRVGLRERFKEMRANFIVPIRMRPTTLAFPGAWMTPSIEMNSATISFLMFTPVS
jgi:hypothetical protein